jgi:hypothetical protein
VTVDTNLGTPPEEAPYEPDLAGDDERVEALARDDGEVAAQRRRVRWIIDLVVVGLCVGFALWHMQPDLLLRNTTPAGGDMGAHVWGPAYLRDHLLPHGQVAGWSPDWYAGFPAYQFYMVVPSLLIVALNAGIHGLGGLLPAAVGAGLIALAVIRRHDLWVRRLAIAGAAVALLLVGLPYGVAFKLVTVSGVATLPVAAYAFGRLAGLRFPTPAVLAVGTLPFLFYRGFTIYGGNIASTLAGEFAFSMSLSFALVYLGLVFKGLETGRYRALAAVTLALTGLCHLIPAFWALGATAVIVAVRFRRSASSGDLGFGLLALATLLAVPAALQVGLGPLLDTQVTTLALIPLAFGVLVAAAALWVLSDSVRWLAPTVVVGGLLSMWWVGPFYLRQHYLNDMGWEKLPYRTADPPETIWKYLLPRATPDVDLRWAFALALVGAGLAVALRLRAGIFLAVVTAGVGVVFVVAPEGRLWNGRLLPFYYLTAILLAFLGVSETMRTAMTAARAPDWTRDVYIRRTVLGIIGGIASLAAAITVLAGVAPDASPVGDLDLTWVFRLALTGVGLCIIGRLWTGVALGLAAMLVGGTFDAGDAPLRDWVVGGSRATFAYLVLALLVVLTVAAIVRVVIARTETGRPDPPGAGAFTAVAALAVVAVLVGVPAGQLPFSERLENGYAWPRFSPWKVTATPASFVTSWAQWNYTGYEGKDSYREYHDVVQTMAEVGRDEGCGRAFWEYEKELDRYGTPMALMLLPHWTDGCIGSMEGLYFESAATTPFHFLTQVELSSKPSAAQRDLPYGGFDINKGVEHLQMLGVKYYMATSENAISQARSHPDLTEIARSGPWVIFEVANSELVTGLQNEPAVVTGITDSQVDWVEQPLDESGRFGGPAIRWYTDPAQWDVPLAASGPDGWQRVRVGERPEARPVPEVEVSNIETGDNKISFDVDQVGSPVLVKASYFPNWKASGAEGPYRVAPNLMVVVPTDRHVELTYGRTNVEWFSYALTLLGLAGLVLLIRRPVMRFSGDSPTAVEAWDGDDWDDEDYDDDDYDDEYDEDFDDEYEEDVGTNGTHEPGGNGADLDPESDPEAYADPHPAPDPESESTAAGLAEPGPDRAPESEAELAESEPDPDAESAAALGERVLDPESGAGQGSDAELVEPEAEGESESAADPEAKSELAEHEAERESAAEREAEAALAEPEPQTEPEPEPQAEAEAGEPEAGDGAADGGVAERAGPES